jgi:hypothetical protein
VSFASIIPCVTSQRMFIVLISLSTQSGNFWIHPRINNAYEVSENKQRFVIFTLVGLLILGTETYPNRFRFSSGTSTGIVS